jgi:hypothetical protein
MRSCRGGWGRVPERVERCQNGTLSAYDAGAASPTSNVPGHGTRSRSAHCASACGALRARTLLRRDPPDEVASPLCPRSGARSLLVCMSSGSRARVPHRRRRRTRLDGATRVEQSALVEAAVVPGRPVARARDGRHRSPRGGSGSGLRAEPRVTPRDRATPAFGEERKFRMSPEQGTDAQRVAVLS